MAGGLTRGSVGDRKARDVGRTRDCHPGLRCDLPAGLTARTGGGPTSTGLLSPAGAGAGTRHLRSTTVGS